MRQRLAIATSSLVAAAVLAIGLGAAGFAPEPRSQAGGDGLGSSVAGTIAEPTIEPEVVYVAPRPTPGTVVVTRRSSDGSAQSSTRDRTLVRATRSDDEDDDEDEAEHRAERKRERVEDRREQRRERAEEREEHEDDD